MWIIQLRTVYCNPETLRLDAASAGSDWGDIIVFNLFCLLQLPVSLLCSLSFDLLLTSTCFLKTTQAKVLSKTRIVFWSIAPCVPETFVYMPDKLPWDINSENSASLLAVKVKRWGGEGCQLRTQFGKVTGIN